MLACLDMAPPPMPVPVPDPMCRGMMWLRVAVRVTGAGAKGGLGGAGADDDAAGPDVGAVAGPEAVAVGAANMSAAPCWAKIAPPPAPINGAAPTIPVPLVLVLVLMAPPAAALLSAAVSASTWAWREDI